MVDRQWIRGSSNGLRALSGVGAVFLCWNLLFAAPALGVTTVTFAGFQHGQPVTAVDNAQITVTNPTGPDLGIVFNTSFTGTEDQDLEGPPWMMGNLAAANTVLDQILIIAEDDTDSDSDGLVDDPDDEGSRPAGTIVIDFGIPVDSFGLDLVDVEPFSGELGRLIFQSGQMSVIRDFADLPLRDSSVEFGDNSANRIAPFLASELGLGSIGAVIVEMGGSGGIDNLVFNEISVPEPATGALLGLGILFALVPGRRR